MSLDTMISKRGKVITVKSKTTSTDVTGSSIETYNTIVGVYRAMFQVGSGSDPQYAGRESRQRTATAYIKDNLDGKIGIADRVSYNGADWEIRSVRVPDEHASTSQMCYTILNLEEVLQ